MAIRHYIIFSLIILALLISGSFLFPVVQMIGATLYLGFFSFILGVIILPKESRPWQAIFGFLILLTYFIITGAGIYFLWKLTTLEIFIILFSLPLILAAAIYLKKRKMPQIPATAHPTDDPSLSPYFRGWIWGGLVLFSVVCLLTLVLAYTLFSVSTSASIRSPWEAISSFWFGLYFIACLVLIYLLSAKSGCASIPNSQFPIPKKLPNYLITQLLNYIPLILFFILSFSVALIVYRQGYGFDQFIHQATEKVIIAQGYILPKPFYYLGQYSLVVILAKMLLIPVELLDRFFLPLLAGIFLPLIILWSLRNSKIQQMPMAAKAGDNPPLSPPYLRGGAGGLALTTLFFLAIPFSSFIVTTPQGLANFFFLIVLFLALPLFLAYNSQPRVIGYWLLVIGHFALASLAIHPLTGIPAILFLTLLSILLFFPSSTTIKKGLKRSLLFLFGIIAAITLPLVFLIANYTSIQKSLGIKFSLPLFWLDLLPSLDIYTSQRFHALYDLIYLYGFNLKWLIAALALMASLWILRTKRNRLLLIYPVFSIILLSNAYLLRHFFSFPGLIAYEQTSFTDRLTDLAYLATLPLLLYFLSPFLARVSLYPFLLTKLALAILGAFTLTVSLYFSYPRVDAYDMSRGYSLGTADKQAVYSIQENAQGQPYVVLANQAVSAAAVQAFGFPTRYPIPTSSTLYKLYLDMVYNKPSAETMGNAMNLAGVSLGYFVINKYWWASDKIIRQAKRETDTWWEIDGGKVVIFQYVP